MTQLTWTTSTGVEIKIEIEEYFGEARPYAHIDGQKHQDNDLVVLHEPVAVGATTVVARIGRVGLNREQCDAVQAAIDALQTEIDARPEVQAQKLIAERKHLAQDLGYAMEALHEAQYRHIEAVSANGYAKAPADKYQAAVDSATAALESFDAEHPEVAGQIEAQRKADTARFLRND